MVESKACGCKGCRTCLICESSTGEPKKNFVQISKSSHSSNCYVYCPECKKAWPGWDIVEQKHPDHVGTPISYPGVYIQLNFINEEEETLLMKGIDEMNWDISQSGRRKQNFGPKTNFKKQKLNLGSFVGFPLFSRFVQDKFLQVPLLADFQTIEQCSLEYNPIRGASIDPHIDDCWIWGERVVTVNCLSDSVLTMNRYTGDTGRYNLPLVNQYDPVVPAQADDIEDDEIPDIIIRIPMPKRSLIVLYGAPRYKWEHRVLREDITERRVCVAYREFTPPYLSGGEKESSGEPILLNAKKFWDHNVTPILLT